MCAHSLPDPPLTTFEEQPIAAASLGQVHRATLRDGREVAAKVQRPGIREQVVEDLEIFATIVGAVDRHPPDRGGE